MSTRSTSIEIEAPNNTGIALGGPTSAASAINGTVGYVFIVTGGTGSGPQYAYISGSPLSIGAAGYVAGYGTFNHTLVSAIAIYAPGGPAHPGGLTGYGAEVFNAGTVHSKGSGIELNGGGYVDNSGVVRADNGVVMNLNGTAFHSEGVVNSGTISFTGFAGIEFFGFYRGNNLTAGITALNSGIISGSSTLSEGIILGSGKYVNLADYVENSGTISVHDIGVRMVGGGTIVNSGQIAGALGRVRDPTGTYNIAGGVDLFSYYHGLVMNRVGASISGGVEAIGEDPTVVNAGTVSARYGIGIKLAGYQETRVPIRLTAGYVLNLGLIETSGTGTEHGIDLVGNGRVVNSGTILTSGAGVAGGQYDVGYAGFAGVAVTNEASGYIRGEGQTTIFGTGYGDGVAGVGTLLNLGTIISDHEFGVQLVGAGTLDNRGRIEGNVRIGTVLATLPGTAANSGTIVGGVVVDGGGLVDNSGLVTSGGNGIVISGFETTVVGTIVNTGSIVLAQAGSTAIEFSTASGVATNAATGYMNGSVLMSGATLINAGRIVSPAFFGTGDAVQAASVVNTGTIADTVGTGIQLSRGGNLVNLGAAAQITGSAAGVATLASATIDNSGTITATGTSKYGAGFLIEDGASLHNTGLIAGGGNGVSGSSYNVGLTIDNAGTIVGTAFYGVRLGTPGLVDNSGAILGHAGVLFAYGGTLIDSGNISGSGGTAVSFGGTGANVVKLDPGFALDGFVVGSGSAGASNTIELAAGSGSLGGLGTSVVNFGTVRFDAGAAWRVDLADPAGFTGTFTGFARGDAIDVAGVVATGYTYANGVLTLENGGTAVAQLNLPVAFPDFALNPDSHGGTAVTVGVPGPPLALIPAAGPQSDLLWQNATLGGEGLLWVMSGDTVVQQVTVANPLGPTWTVAGTGYFDPGVDQSDVILQDQASGKVELVLVEGGKVSVAPLQGVPPADFNPNWQVVGSGDFNGDGNSDLVFQYRGPAGDPQDGAVRIWLMNGTTVVSDPGAVVNIPLPASALADFRLIAAGDFNGDGKSDLLAQYEGPTGGGLTTGDVAVGLLNGTTIVGGGLVTAGGTVLHVPSPNWHVVGAGDFNGDGKSDILAQYQGPTGDQQDGAVAIARMNGSALLGGLAGLTLLGNPDAVAGGPWTAVGTGAFDPSLPGNADIFFQNAAGDEAMVWQLNATGTGFTQGPTLTSMFGSGWTLQHG